jgi:hypothetical protein
MSKSSCGKSEVETRRVAATLIKSPPRAAKTLPDELLTWEFLNGRLAEGPELVRRRVE